MHFVGIDVSKKHLDVALSSDSAVHRFENNEAGFEKLAEFLQSYSIQLVALEATGGFETRAAAKLAAAPFPVAVINPRQVRDFARSCGILAKTDAIDAKVIARFAEAVRPEPRLLRDEETQELHDFGSRRRQLVEIRAVEKTRRHAASGRIKRDIEEHIAWLDARIKDLDKELEAFIRSSPIWRQTDDLLRSVPCVGPNLSALLIADFGELGKYSRQQIAALAGVAPMNRDSGSMKGRRTVWGGRAALRRVLYMAVVSGLQHNMVLKEFYERLITAGKAPKVALTACMRKLLTILNAMMRSGKRWDPALFLEKA